MLSIALPNGSLEEGTMKLFEEANLKVLRAPRQHGAKIEDPRISRVTIMRPQHIPRLVEQGTYDLGVCGHDSILGALRKTLSARLIGVFEAAQEGARGL
jgi:ATP phosphoribosyltransferase